MAKSMDLPSDFHSATLPEHQTAMRDLLEEFDRVCTLLDIPYFLFAGTLLGAVRHQDFIPWDDDLDVILLRKDYERFLAQADRVLNGEKFYLQKEFSQHWPMFFSKLRLNGTTCLEKYHPRDPESHQGIYMDIFPCDNARENPILRKLQFFCSKIVISKGLYQRGYDTDRKTKKIALQLCRFLPQRPFRWICMFPKGGDSTYVHCFLGGASSYEKSVFPRAWFSARIRLPFGGGIYQAPKAYDPLLTTLYGDYMQIPEESQRRNKVHAILVDLTQSYEGYAHYRDSREFTEFTRSIR